MNASEASIFFFFKQHLPLDINHSQTLNTRTQWGNMGETWEQNPRLYYYWSLGKHLVLL